VCVGTQNSIRRILDGERIPTINLTVDAYFLVETETLLPLPSVPIADCNPYSNIR
jgi:DNA/RNA-binding domain of Phe-tRNA-synthetase-like protein